MQFIRAVLVIIVLASCAPLPTATPLPTSQIVHIGLTPALRSWQSRFNLCADQMTGVGLAFYEAPQAEQPAPLLNYDFFGQLGGDIPEQAFSTSLGVENLVWIIHVDNPASQVTPDQLLSIYEGKISGWEVINPSTEAADLPITPWMYASNDSLYTAFRAVVWGERAYPPQASLAPDPAAMLEAVSTDPGAIGFLPESWLNVNQLASDVRAIQLVEENEPMLAALPVIVVSTKEPTGASRSLLLCVLETLH